jgi:hypothetical protein
MDKVFGQLWFRGIVDFFLIFIYLFLSFDFYIIVFKVRDKPILIVRLY